MLPSKHYNNPWVPDVFNDFFDNDWMVRSNATAPAINVLETENSYELELAAPGMTKEDFKVTLDNDGDLVINMEKKQEEKRHGHFLRREYSYTKFQQTMLLPDDADREKIDAKVINGELKVSIPKIKRVSVQDTKKTIEVK
ncbi:MAG: Hsp20/alpha crystallin family protein [Bacteroidales bacterium]|nr:Hsp20/alpha crystallin family protein [Bacteroidales bacterium]